MICDAHIHVGRYYHMTDAEAFDRSGFYYEPKVVADVLKLCGVGLLKYFGTEGIRSEKAHSERGGKIALPHIT